MPAACTRRQGSWSASAQQIHSRAARCPSTRASIFPRNVLGANAPDFETAGTTLHEDDAIRLWTLDGDAGAC